MLEVDLNLETFPTTTCHLSDSPILPYPLRFLHPSRHCADCHLVGSDGCGGFVCGVPKELSVSGLSAEYYVWSFVYVRPSGRVLLLSLWPALPPDWAGTEEALPISILMTSRMIFVHVLGKDCIAVSVWK